MATILIVDDQPANRQALMTLLGRAGHQLLEAGGGDEALVVARAERPDLIVTGIVMPAMDGYDLARMVRADPVLNQTQIVFYAASTVSAEMRRLAEAYGVAHIIARPAEPHDILRTIDQALSSPPPPAWQPVSEASLQDDMRLLTDKLAEKVKELEKENAERRRVEQALWSSEAELRALFAAMNDVILVLDANGKYLKIAPTTPPAFYRTTGRLIGRRLHDVFLPEQADIIVASIRRALASGQPVPVDYRLVVGGDTIWFEAAISPLGPDSVVLIARDITARKLAESEVRESEAHLRTLFENAPISIWEEDFSAVKRYLDRLPGGLPANLDEFLAGHPAVVADCVRLVKVIDVNQATLELLQAPNKANLLGGLAMYLTTESRDVFQQELVAIARGLPRLKLDATVRTRAGHRRDVTLYWAVVPGHEQQYSRVLLSLVDITERKRAEQETERQLERLSALRAIDMAISASLDLQLTLQIVLDQVMIQLQVDAADVFLLNAAAQSIDYAAGRGFRSEVKPAVSLQLGQEYAGRVALERRTLAVPDFAKHKTGALRAATLKAEGIRAYYGVPLIAKGTVTGVLELFHRAPLHPDQDWLDFLEALAGQAAIAIDNAALFNDLQRSNQNLNQAYDATIEGWSRALDMRDRETEGHSQRVMEMTLRLATRAGMAAEQLVHIRRGALLHDIGKMGIPDKILLKPGPLSQDEWAIMRQHPIHAYNLLSPIQYLRQALDIPYCHHEKWDGSGYPRRLKEHAIPLPARIFTVVDEWDALLSDRPYRRGWPEADVRDHIRAEAGRHFDPEVVRTFEQLMAEER